MDRTAGLRTAPCGKALFLDAVVLHDRSVVFRALCHDATGFAVNSARSGIQAGRRACTWW